jgi:hypothetical protein
MSFNARVSVAPGPGPLPDAWLYERADGASDRWSEVALTSETSILATGLPELLAVRFRIRAVVNGVVAPEVNAKVLVLSPGSPGVAAPPALEDLTVAQSGWRIVATWTQLARLPFAVEIEFREGPDWAQGIVRRRVPVTEHRSEWGYFAPVATHVIARIRDVFGRYGPEVSADITPIADEYYVVKTTVSEAGFPGTSSNLLVDGSGATSEETAGILDDWAAVPLTDIVYPLGARYKPESSYTTAAQDRGATVTEKIEVTISPVLVGGTVPLAAWRVNFDPAVGPDGSPRDLNEPTDFDLVTLEGKPARGLGVVVEVAHSTSDASGGNAWKTLQPDCVYTFRYVRLRVRFTSPLGLFAIRIATMSWTLRRRNLKKHGTDVGNAGDAAGTTITFPVAFSTVPDVNVSANFDGRATVVPGSVTAVDFKVKLYDTTNARATGSFTWHALGE